MKKIESKILLFIEFCLLLLGFLSLLNHSAFLLTKREVTGKVLKIEKHNVPKPYSLTIQYFDEYENKTTVMAVEDIDGRFGAQNIEKWKSGFACIYYKNYFPQKIYLCNYKFPNLGFIFMDIVYIVVLSFGCWFLLIKIRKKGIEKNINKS